MPSPDLDRILDAIRAAGGQVNVAAQGLGIPASSLRSQLHREGAWDQVEAIRGGDADEEGLSINGDGSKTAVGTPWTAEELIRKHGDDPAECEILRKRGNWWGDPAKPSHQLRVDWIRKSDIIRTVDPGSWTPPPKPKKAKRGDQRIVLCGDHHAPLHDKTLHKLFCARLRDTQPDLGVMLGDTMDFSTVSRFREKEGFAHGVNECLQAAFGIIRDYREASPDTRWILLKGNHDARLEFAILDNSPALHGVRAADEELPALSLRRLLHLDALGVEFIEGDWETTKYVLCRNLTARHGVTIAKNAPEQMLSKLTRSTVQGHSHRLSFGYRTDHDNDPDVPTNTRLAVEAGCMAEIKDGLGHSVDPNWQQSFLEGHIWKNGDFALSPCVYAPGRLLCPDGRKYE